jgi:hypothetical protein
MRKVTANFLDDTIISMESGCGSNTRSGTYEIFPNDWCCIDPPNPRTKKHRGRICKFTGEYRENDYGALAKVRFADTGRTGFIDIAHLIPASPEQIPVLVDKKI